MYLYTLCLIPQRHPGADNARAGASEADEHNKHVINQLLQGEIPFIDDRIRSRKED